MVNIPNILTSLRIISVPVFIYLVLASLYSYALVIFIAAGITDAADGYIARRLNQRTELGASMDGFADKLLLSSSYIVLTFKGFFPLWLCVPVILKDVVILSGVLMLKTSGKKISTTTSIFGKLTTILQIATVIYTMLFGASGFLFFALAVVTAVITLYTGFDYVTKEFKAQYGEK